MQLVLLSGVSGSGKSVALKALEDAGYFCVDNLPAELVGPLADYARTRGEERVAISADARSRESLGGLPAIIEQLRANGIDVRVIFLDTDDESLLRRFSETRRPHPLAEGRTIAEAIAEERRVLSWLSEIGQRIDTSHLSPNQLRGWIRDLVVTDRQKLTLIFESFGFKGGAPLDADFVFDARSQAFLQRWLPRFMLDQRASITVAVGCTGGRHRSIYIANQLAERFRSEYPVVVRHRDTQA
jgi:UPF0042 nucleotide-binding protein